MGDFKLSIIFLCWLLFAIFSLGVGQYHLNIVGVLEVMMGGGDNVARDIVYRIRLPRVLMSSLCGGILALCGVSLQGLFKNPLVDSKIIGVSTGASFGGALAILLGFGGFYLVGFAFIFGVVALLLLYYIASFVKGFSIFTLILSGIVVNGFFAALISLIQYIADSEEVLPTIVFWLLGSFVNANYHKLMLLALVALPCIVALFLMRWRFDLLSLDDVDARILGLNLFYLRIFILGVSTLLIATQVSISGSIGWIGLIVPHIARAICGDSHIKSLPYSFAIGMIFMLLIDNLSRTLTVAEIPLGVLCALVGTPIFAYLLKKGSKNVA